MNRRIIGSIVGVCALFILGGVMLFLTCRNEKTAYVNITKLYAEFTLKKELENKLTKVKNTRQAVLDSLELKLKILTKEINMEKGTDKAKIAVFQAQREAYISKKQQFDEDNQALVKEYDAQIYKQMTQYVSDYGKKKGYKYIYGADGSGNLMYADESDDITFQVTTFINNRYKGISD